MKTQLFHALREADYTTLDHYQVDKVRFNAQSRVVILECPVDDGDITFADQDIEVSDGDAVAFDVTGDKRALTFVAKVPWAPTAKVVTPVEGAAVRCEELVRHALDRVRSYWPDVVKVIYDGEGRWRYVDADWNLVRWENPVGGKLTKIQRDQLTSEMEEARDAVDNERGFPAVFEFDL